MTHLKKCLKDYINTPEPGYAVLVTGNWGAGKTYQVKQCIPEDIRLYVSLYGVQTVEQLHSEVLAAYAQRSAKIEKVAEMANRIADETPLPFAWIGKIPNIAAPLFRREMKNDKTLVFDDLERCNIDPDDVLGAINYYVEHRQFRVVVIAHDERLKKQIRKMKEKIFGQILHIEPQVDEVLPEIIAGIGEKTSESKQFVSEHKDEIAGIFTVSNVKSLRILRHAVINLIQLYGTLTKEHKKNSDAMRYLAKFFLAFQFEVRAGRLSESDLRNRRGATERFNEESKGERRLTEVPAIVKAKVKYNTVDLESDLLNDDVLCATLLEGRFQEKEIREAIDGSSEFLVPGKEPAWKLISHIDYLEDSVVQQAISDMDRQFKAREIKDPYEILSMFNSRIRLADEKIIGKDVKTILFENDEYIDDLAKNHDLKPYRPNGVRYHAITNPYTELTDRHINTHRKSLESATKRLEAVLEDEFQRISPELRRKFLAEFEDNPSLFLWSLSRAFGDRYKDIAVLQLIEPVAFVDAWMRFDRAEWQYIVNTLEARCQVHHTNPQFQKERTWALDVVKEIMRRSQELGLKGYRFRYLLPKLRFIKEYAETGNMGPSSQSLG